MARPNGKILHAEISICGSVVMIGDPDDKLYSEPRALGRCTASLHIFLDDNAALLRRAVEAGAEEIQPHRHILWREFRQRGRSLRPCLGAAFVEGGSRSGRDGTPGEGIPGPVSAVTSEPRKGETKHAIHVVDLPRFLFHRTDREG
jgi:hypothetical protein